MLTRTSRRLLQKYGEILELDEKRGYAIQKTYPQEMNLYRIIKLFYKNNIIG